MVALKDTITFNSIKLVETDAAWAKTNAMELPIVTNETNFVGARESTGKNEGVKNVWEDTQIMAEDEWAEIGYAGFDGKILGGYRYINYVSIRVKVIYDEN